MNKAYLEKLKEEQLQQLEKLTQQSLMTNGAIQMLSFLIKELEKLEASEKQ